MPEPILDEEYWKGRYLRYGKKQLHHSIFRCPKEVWDKVEQRHKEMLESLILPHQRILDIGCGYGRLLDMLPENWRGMYVGIDLCHQFLELAREKHPGDNFFQCDFTKPIRPQIPTDDPEVFPPYFEVGVAISIKPMIIRNLGEGVWETVRANIDELCCSTIILEYDEDDMAMVHASKNPKLNPSLAKPITKERIARHGDPRFRL